MSGFKAVNTASLALGPTEVGSESKTPTTPCPNIAPNPQPHETSRVDDAKTPTKASFGALASQRPLPESPFPAAMNVPENVSAEKHRTELGGSQYSSKSRESEDVEMDDGGGSEDGGEDGSDDESVNADGTRSSKKKKTQRFWCTDYPPCNLSFTRSEHLARHIRKHTGERPFQCHCSRRFSRLDNLRQHAQTVHVNEDIPTDSLAATGTRFQRQIRTERVRPAANRSRASTASSIGSQGRGHHRNSLSASSISSISSTFSQRDDRRRPAPLVMAADPRARLSIESYGSVADASNNQYPSYQPQSPGGYSTPTSATFSTGQNSPRWGSGMQSPISSHSRTVSLYAGHRTPGRRLSVPSGANPFQSPHSNPYGQPPLTPINSNHGGFSSASSMVGSPTTSTSGSTWSRRESMSSAADEAWRRRTWHPETYTNYSTRLSNVTTPSYYENALSHHPHGLTSNPQTTRLPGIESFDPLRRPVTPPRRIPSPMMIDTPSRAPIQESHAEHYHGDEGRSHQQWDMGLHRNLNRLEIAHSTPSQDAAGAWASDANNAVQAQAEHVRSSQPTVRFEQRSYISQPNPPKSFQGHQHTISAPPITPREAKRQGWYNGPITPTSESRGLRASPDNSSSPEGGRPTTPSNMSTSECSPVIVHSAGWGEQSKTPAPLREAPRPPQQVSTNGYQQSYPAVTDDKPYGYRTNPQPMAPSLRHDVPKSDNNMLRLEALVAVATSEENAATAY